MDVCEPHVRRRGFFLHSPDGNEADTDVVAGASIYDPGILTLLDPWAGNPTNHPKVQRIRPWAAPENAHLQPDNQKNSKHPSVVTPVSYDTDPGQA